MIENRRIGRAMVPDNPPCSYYDSIFHLELAKPELFSWGGLCHYSLGERVLHDLHTHLEEEEFFESFRAVHASVSAEDAGDIPARQHFVEHVSFPTTSPAADETIRKMSSWVVHYGEVINTDSQPREPRDPRPERSGNRHGSLAENQWRGHSSGSYEGILSPSQRPNSSCIDISWLW